jgi:hypothetical protein
LGESFASAFKTKIPGSTEKELKEAHAYAYGGAVVPDMGYFPAGVDYSPT